MKVLREWIALSARYVAWALALGGALGISFVAGILYPELLPTPPTSSGNASEDRSTQGSLLLRTARRPSGPQGVPNSVAATDPTGRRGPRPVSPSRVGITT